MNIHPYLRRFHRLKFRHRTATGAAGPAWSSEQSERLITPTELDQARREPGF